MLLLICLPLLFTPPNPPACVVDQCDGSVCSLEGPDETFTDVPRKHDMAEGDRVVCPTAE